MTGANLGGNEFDMRELKLDKVIERMAAKNFHFRLKVFHIFAIGRVDCLASHVRGQTDGPVIGRHIAG